MDDQQRDAFLAGTYLGALAVAREDGAPHLLPIWYRWDGSAVLLWTDPAFPWARRLAVEPRVAFAVFEHAHPFRAVYIRGTASLRVGSFAELRDAARAIVARYDPPAELDRVVDRYDRGTPKAIVTITPTAIRALVNS
jgi:nitroimidazol reductase NimA-like FMN-containing flavoprotein (pyridoxamine 5'-phosphate oxidase superfamily)